ncbi:MAG: ABC transporter ATP-binding component [Candidatus Scalindua brodae]|uniref:ABC transporter ATP-binding component n=1 Tax=Candidatus Scalindua brodae TaxID=237368 RepID=A0A0B0EKQ7_9BACT|nr:MAG: ABC transporter ATP-binding component [Candidatus Scalindua brodae]
MTFNSGSKNIIALDNISFDVEQGKLFCIVGPSGCGKSTLLRIILGLLEPNEGTVWTNPTREKLGVAYVQQHALLLPWRTLLQNAALGIEIKSKLNPRTIERVKKEIREYRLNEFETNLPSELSGGMKQKADIIRALESRPKLLFCD